MVPTVTYLEHVYKTNHKTIHPYLAKEAKKRGAEKLQWDVSYKETNHLCWYRGHPIFKGLVTTVNEFGEFWIQFPIYTDSKEKMTSALKAVQVQIHVEVWAGKASASISLHMEIQELERDRNHK